MSESPEDDEDENGGDEPGGPCLAYLVVLLGRLGETKVDLALVHAVVVVVVLLRRAVRLAAALQLQVAAEQLEAAKVDLLLGQSLRVHLPLVVHGVGVKGTWCHREELS